MVPVVLEPIRHDGVLSVFERHGAGADLPVEVVLDCILALGAHEMRRKGAMGVRRCGSVPSDDPDVER